MADANTAVIVLACVQGAATLVLAAVTFSYAKTTARMSDAARRQADASVETAREMREQRLAEERPYLLLDAAVATEGSWGFPQGSNGDDINEMHPTTLWCGIHNAGPGPAKELAVTMLHPHMEFEIERRGYLLVNQSWEPEPLVKAAPLAKALSGVKPLGLSDWLAKQGAPPHPVGDQYDAGLVVGYRDISGSPWATYLALGLDVYTDMRFDNKDPRHFSKRVLKLHGQRRIQLKPDFAL